MRLGIFLPNWVGDVVMATPALRAFRKYAGPDGTLVGIMRPYVAEVLAGNTWLNEQLIYDKSDTRLGLPRRHVIQSMRRARLDQIVLLTNSWRTAWIAWRSRASERIGFRHDARSLLLTKAVSMPTTANGKILPTVEGYLYLSEAVGCQPEPPILELATTPADEEAANEVWRQLDLPAGDRVVVLNSGGAFGAAKHWPAEYFAELARRIAHGNNYAVLVNCGPSEREIAREIVARANEPRVVGLADWPELPVGLTKACIRRSRLLVTTDSGPRYFGVAFGRSVVTLFGPTDPAHTRLPYGREACLSLNLDCQPCMKRTCPLKHHRCMRDLIVDTVFSAATNLLKHGTAQLAEPVADHSIPGGTP
ncbi:MAG: lipopolysaccharide heptosyltransferase II [Pirellulales bacterium]